MIESEAVTLAQSGDYSGFEYLYALHRLHVMNLCRRMLRNEEEAEDLTQEVFLHVWQKINLFDHRSAFNTWLYKLATNRVLQHMRHKKRRPPSGAGDPPEHFELPDQHKRLEIQEALGKLSEMEQLCLEGEMTGNTLRYHGGANYLRSVSKQLREVLA